MNMKDPKITSYYCTCSQFILSITPALDLLPTRGVDASEDQSIVISRERDQCVFTLDAYRDKYPIAVKNKSGQEVWWVYKCPRCKLPVAYDLESTGQRFTYVLNDALHKNEEDGILDDEVEIKTEIKQEIKEEN